VWAVGGVHSASELDDGVEEEVCGDLHRLQGMRETPVVTGMKVGAKRWRATGSSSHNTPALCASYSRTLSSSRYASHLSAIHVDLHCVGCRQWPRGRWVGLCTEESCGGRGQLPTRRMRDSSRDIEGPIGGCDARRAWRRRALAMLVMSTRQQHRSCPTTPRASPTVACSPPPSFSPSCSTSSPHLSCSTSPVCDPWSPASYSLTLSLSSPNSSSFCMVPVVSSMHRLRILSTKSLSRLKV
jgi:hypothetical protein